GFCVAMQLIEGDVFVDQMVEQNIARPDLIDLANRIKGVRSIEREQKGPRFRKGSDVTVKLKNGRTLQKTIDHRPGSQQLPLSAEQMSIKYRRLAKKALSPQQIDKLEEIVEGLERAPSVAELVKVLRAK